MTDKQLSTSTPLIELKGINKYFKMGQGELHVLKNLDLTIHRGEFLMIMGKSGSGKTTLMNIIGFLDQANNGEYVFDEQDASKLTENQKSELRNKYIGFIFQQFFLIQSLNVSQNVELPMVYEGLKKEAQRREIAHEYLSLVGLEGKEHSKATELSGGQQQRVAIARALVNEPLLIMADEPTGALDSETSSDIMNILAKLNDEGKTIVMVTHDPDMRKYATRVVYMKDGVFLEEEEFLNG